MRLRSVAVATQPVVEPVSLAEAKSHLGLVADQTDDDALIVNLLATARRVVEKRLGVALSPTQLRARFDVLDESGWPGSIQPAPLELRLPVSPALSGGTYGQAVDVDGVAVTSGWSIDTDAAPAVIRFTARPTLLPLSVLTVTYWAGPAAGIAPQLRSAILLLVGHLFANRESVAADRMLEVPMAFETLLASESISGRW